MQLLTSPLSTESRRHPGARFNGQADSHYSNTMSSDWPVFTGFIGTSRQCERYRVVQLLHVCWSWLWRDILPMQSYPAITDTRKEFPRRHYPASPIPIQWRPEDARTHCSSSQLPPFFSKQLISIWSPAIPALPTSNASPLSSDDGTGTRGNMQLSSSYSAGSGSSWLAAAAGNPQYAKCARR